MFNQFILVGKVREIYEDAIDLGIAPLRENDSETILKVKVCPDVIPNILLNNVCGVKGHIEKDNELYCDKLTILNSKGISNGD